MTSTSTRMSVRPSSLLAIAIATVSMIAACGSSKKADEGPPCGQIVDHINEITKTIPGHETVEDPRMGNDRKSMIGLCEKRHYSAEAKTCILATKDTEGLADCLHKHVKIDKDDLNRPRPIGGNSGGTMPGATPAP